MSAVSVLRDPGHVAAALTPLRLRLLRNLREPDSATGLARRLELPRQRVNYHLRALEDAGLLELVEERRRRGCVERCLRVTSRAFVVDPVLLGPEFEPQTTGNRLASAELLALAAQALRDVAVLRERAAEVGLPLTTQALSTDIAFASPDDFRAFGEELVGHVAALAARYHRPDAPGARTFRLSNLVHPTITKSADDHAAEVADAEKGTQS